MPRTLHRPAPSARVTPSVVDPAKATPFTLEQELKPFGAWTEAPIWVPPKDVSGTFAETMLEETGPFVSQHKRWEKVVEKHRRDFTQVREIDLFQASIRLPKGKFFVTVTEQENFDKITDPIPACVRTRLEEFLSGPGKKRGTKVYYLKPLCVEIGDELILTTREDLMAAIDKVRGEAFAEYARIAPGRRTQQALTAVTNLGLALPRALVKTAIDRRKKMIDAYQNRLEFERRKLALRTAETHRKIRSNGCTFDEILNLTSPLDRGDVVGQYCDERKVSGISRNVLLSLAMGSVPWFVALSITMSYVSAITVTVTPPIVVCDPAFVAEMPDQPGVLLNIGHFDEVGGVTHVEL